MANEPDWAAKEAERYLGQWNPRFTLYREQDPAFRQDEVDRLAAALRGAFQEGIEHVERKAASRAAVDLKDVSWEIAKAISLSAHPDLPECWAEMAEAILRRHFRADDSRAVLEAGLRAMIRWGCLADKLESIGCPLPSPRGRTLYPEEIEWEDDKATIRAALALLPAPEDKTEE